MLAGSVLHEDWRGSDSLLLCMIHTHAATGSTVVSIFAYCGYCICQSLVL